MLWLENSHELLRNVPLDSVWDQALYAEPEPHRRVGPAHLDDVCSALADFVDLASPFTTGHSSGVARLAESAAKNAGSRRERGGDDQARGPGPRPRDGQRPKPGLDQAEAAQSRRVGTGSPARVSHASASSASPHRCAAWRPSRVCITSASTAPATTAARTRRRSPLAGPHPRGGGDLQVDDARREPGDRRSHRRRPHASCAMRSRVDASTLVLSTPSYWRPVSPDPGEESRRAWPAGLTDREVDVLRAITRGLANKQIARELHVSQATVHTHVINLYGKIGVNTPRRRDALRLRARPHRPAERLRNQPNG